MGQVPVEWWREAVESTSTPIAAVGLDNVYLWANSAYEELVGYSAAELKQMTWIDLTVQADVGGDLASVQELKEGKTNRYTMAKRYRHKQGQIVPNQLTVWRHPKNSTENLICYIVQAIPKKPLPPVDLIQDVRRLEKQIEHMAEKHGVNVNVGNHDGDNVGRDKSTNSEQTIRWLIVGVVALAMAVVWLAYYSSDDGKEKPELTPMVSPTTGVK